MSALAVWVQLFSHPFRTMSAADDDVQPLEPPAPYEERRRRMQAAGQPFANAVVPHHRGTWTPELVPASLGARTTVSIATTGTSTPVLVPFATTGTSTPELVPASEVPASELPAGGFLMVGQD